MGTQRSIRDCSVCVVGGAGFLGSHLVEYLLARGCKVLVIDNLVAGRREFVPARVAFEHADITGSEDYLRALFGQYEVEYVFNYAAYPYVPDSYARPLQVCNVNFFGAMKVINAAQLAGVKAILQVSSAEVYGNGPARPIEDCERTGVKIGEDAEVTPHSSYGVSKAAIDAWVQCRWKEAGTPVIALRQFNCVGERETHPYVLTEIISQLHHKGNTLALGNNTTRDFMYAGDAVRLAVELLEKGEFGEVYNLGSETSISVYDLAQLVSECTGGGRVTITQDPARVRPWDIWHLQSANSKLYRAIEGRPEVPLREAVQRTVAYYEENGREWCWEK